MTHTEDRRLHDVSFSSFNPSLNHLFLLHLHTLHHFCIPVGDARHAGGLALNYSSNGVRKGK